jgi:succinoglycan biosynthesis protein ExoA
MHQCPESPVVSINPSPVGVGQTMHEVTGEAKATKPHRDAPPVTVVVPVRNEAKHIEACIDRLLSQDYPRPLMEILIVDGRSDDGTRDVVSRVQAQFPDAELRLLDNPARTVPQALNIGIRAARSEIVIRMDGHTIPADDYISACVQALEASGAANVGGYWTSHGDTNFGTAVALATSHSLGMGNVRYRAGGAAGDVDTVPFGAFRRDAFRRVGQFDESMTRNQDYEMNVRLRNAGERIYFDPAIRFTYTPRGTVGALWRQYFQYGWWRVETLRRHPSSIRVRQVIPPAFVAALLLFALLTPWTAVPLAGLAAIYLSTILAVSFRVAKERSSPLLVALAFMTIHLAFGLGFLLNVVSLGTFPYRAGPPRIPRLEDPA